MVEAHRAAGGTGPLALQVHLSWAPTEAEAEQIAHEQWRSNVFGEPVAWDLETVEAFDIVSERRHGGEGPHGGRRLLRPGVAP